MNYEHGATITFVFNAPASSCPDGVISAKFNGESIPAGRTIWFIANLKPEGPIVNGTEITVTNSVITVNGVNAGALPSGLVRYVAGLARATTNFIGGQWVPASLASKK